jgi:CelD/BcsL family acetyltransferase involved in cellulose biosynthesis
MKKRFSIALTDFCSVKELAQQWRILDMGNTGSFFTSWTWIGTWLTLLPPDIRPQLLRIERDGQLHAAAIAIRGEVRRLGIIKTRCLHINETGDPHLDCLTIEHNGLLSREPIDPAVWQALLEWFESGAAEADELSISGVTHDLTAGFDRPVLMPSDRQTLAYRVDLASIRDAGGSVGSILSANSRQQLSRSMRAFSAMGVLKLEAATHIDEALAFFEGLKRLHIRSWTRRGQRHGFVDPFAEQFHRKLIESNFPRSGVQLLRLRAGTRELGYLYNFLRNGIVYAYQSGFDDEDRHLRPGYVAHALAIERSASAGAMMYDFMGGTNRLKQSFATEQYVMHWYKMQRPLLLFRAEQAVRAAKRRFLRSRSQS